MRAARKRILKHESWLTRIHLKNDESGQVHNVFSVNFCTLNNFILPTFTVTMHIKLAHHNLANFGYLHIVPVHPIVSPVYCKIVFVSQHIADKLLR